MDGSFSGVKTQTLNLLKLQLKQSIFAEHEEEDITPFTVNQGETVTLRCDIYSEGVTSWSYSWYKEALISIKMDHSSRIKLQRRPSPLSQSHMRVSTTANTQREESHPRAGSQSEIRVRAINTIEIFL
uniref:Ig-like domain-containing protein n=1 Tax=Cyprinus carpio TaxID=7962 RepID=A0A8C1MYY0_CYPCA